MTGCPEQFLLAWWFAIVDRCAGEDVPAADGKSC